MTTAQTPKQPLNEDSQPALILPRQVDDLLHARLDDPFGLLGLHEWGDDAYVLRAFLPGAKSCSAVSADGRQVLSQMAPQGEGVFAALIAAKKPFNYKLKIDYGSQVVVREDPYRFSSTLGETDLYLFGEGSHERLYDWLGAHVKTIDGVRGVRFCVWAPNAKRVSVVGNFNFWDGRQHLMRKLFPAGVWEIFIPELEPGELYKYEILGPSGDVLPHKADPFAFSAELSPGTASRIVDADSFEWRDHAWMQARRRQGARDEPISIYEVHLGSWRRKVEEGNRYLSYRELADELVPYAVEMGFTHIQMMPVSEFPFNGSWGYQPVGMFAPTSRFGGPDDFKFFIDACHRAGLGVLMDWVPGHFPSDGHGLAWFDGTPLYEHADWRQGFHPDWNTFIYNYGRREVSNYLYANALYWFDKFHIDGLRVDAVASMLYLDYSRAHDQWIPNQYGGRENLEAIDLLRRVNTKVYEHFPDVMMIAEESTAWPGVSHPIYAGGLGFGYKWNMGWMNDTLRYMEKDPVYRQYHHHDMTFSLLYAFNENFILPLSHDEVVHGKHSLLDKMPGGGADKFAQLRAYLGYMWTHPGKKLLFMGGEFAQGREWNHNTSLDWHLLDVPWHRGIQNLVKDLNHYYRSSRSLHGTDCDSGGFEWLEADDRHNSIFAFVRKSQGQPLQVVVLNMTPMLQFNYLLGVPLSGFYRERLNSDARLYGGEDRGNAGGVSAVSEPAHGRPYSINLVVPPYSCIILQHESE